MRGCRSRVKGIQPAQVRAMGRSWRNGKSSCACAWLVWMPSRSGVLGTSSCLSPVEVAGEPLSLVMSEFERRLLVAVGMGVPVEVGLECTDAVKDRERHGSRGPHLAAHGIHGDRETEHGAQGAAPRPGC